jgi:hypothetical protein
MVPENLILFLLNLAVDGIKDSVVIESLQKGIIKSEPFHKG